jgi:hypothetical protein
MNLLRRRRRRSVLTLVAFCTALTATAVAPTARAVAPSPDKPAVATPPARTAGPAKDKAGASPFAPAIAALQKEYQTSLKEKKGEGLREKCDYFSGQEKPEGATPEALLAVLDKPLPGGGDARAEAYVKWQLLSALDGKFPDALKAKAIQAYRKAPAPAEHPYRNHTPLDRKLTMLGNKPEAEAGINKDVSDALEKYRLYIDPILDYRDEFYNRLPDGYDTLVAGYQDTKERVMRGAPASEFWKKLGGQIRAWALTSSDPGLMRQMGNAVLQLNAFVKDERNKPYYRVIYEKNEHNIGLKWQSQSTIDQEQRYVGELGEWLEERAKNPGGAGGGLQFKDKDEMKKGK